MNDIWMGWLKRESGSQGYACMGDRGRAYGAYQFDYRYALVPFLKRCVQAGFSDFSKFATYKQGNPILVDNDALKSLFVKYAKRPEFCKLQDTMAMEEYYIPAAKYMSKRYGINPDNHSAAFRGSLFSMAIRSGQENGASRMNQKGTEEEILRKAYATYGSEDAGRWPEQLRDALLYLKGEQIMTAKDITICGHGSSKPSTKNLYTYSATRYTKDRGIVCVLRHKKMTDALRKEFHDTYRTILGRNNYNQNLRLFCYKPYTNGKYYSDCSSSGCLTYEKIGLECPAYNTAEMYNSKLFEQVAVNIKNGQIIDADRLKVGDAIMYRGSDPSRPRQIGHVEFVYEINGTTPSKESGGNKYMFETQTVKLNSKSSSVLLCQTMLKGLGYKGKDNRDLLLDGECGLNTVYAINSYQSARRKKGIELGSNGANDGICGKKMWADLIKL